MKMNLKKMIITALLIAISIVITLIMPKVTIPPFTMTLGVHVPLFISMFFGPVVAGLVGLGSTIGFLLVGLPPYVMARAAMHLFVGIIGALLVKRKVKYPLVAVITAPIHAGLEALIVVPFGFSFTTALLTVGIGSLIHHSIDATIAYPIILTLKRAFRKDFNSTLESKKLSA